MIIGIYPGCFDPITWGHLDIIKRSIKFCDRLIVAVGVNSAKKTLFTKEERIKQIDTVINRHVEFLDSTNIYVDSFESLLIDFARKVEAKLLIRGIRSVSDFEYEITLANANKLLAPDIQTIFLPTSSDLQVVSSSAVKEIGKHGGPIHHFVPPEIEKAVKLKFGFEPASIVSQDVPHRWQWHGWVNWFCMSCGLTYHGSDTWGCGKTPDELAANPPKLTGCKWKPSPKS